MMNNDIPQISSAEWEVMKIIWAKFPRTANQIVEALQGIASWKPKTIRTLINRLVKKGALGYDKEGREYLYYPRIDEDTCVRSESRSFLKRVFRGSLQPMLAHFLENEKLSKEEIKELKQILEKKSQ